MSAPCLFSTHDLLLFPLVLPLPTFPSILALLLFPRESFAGPMFLVGSLFLARLEV
jgi:hypothetical protein